MWLQREAEPSPVEARQLEAEPPPAGARHRALVLARPVPVQGKRAAWLGFLVISGAVRRGLWQSTPGRRVALEGRLKEQVYRRPSERPPAVWLQREAEPPPAGALQRVLVLGRRARVQRATRLEFLVISGAVPRGLCLWRLIPHATE